ncbi:transforming protein [Alces alces papillomavirus 1]|uniref:Protein E6 n=1 Tax=European elk papillomavirus TaxID=2885846 RepID=VE6_PAPVE|nr:transforming protein [Alces alces papillomavirus 1]P11331.1 RecName: Full=Protein E6 [Alces alces papillomavirus 1]AAA66849.1 transforming protein [Alces alces papillomavirus 1]
MCGECYAYLTCIWCKKGLDKVDAKRCHEKKIRIACRNGKHCAVCTSCLENGLYLERSLFPGRPIYPGDLYEPDPWVMFNDIRCMYCGGCLTRDEKERHRLFCEDFWIFRHQVRGRCYLCTRHGSRPPYKETPAAV